MLNRVKNSRSKLSSAEGKVARWILAQPHRAVSATLAQIAQNSKVSEPTVIRFCRSLGATGFRDFKTRLTQYLAAEDHFVHAEVTRDDNTNQIIAKVMGKSIRELVGVKQRLSAVQLDAAVTVLAQAKRIDFYGIGASGIVVHDAQNKFFRLGVPCCAYNDAPSILQAAAIADSDYAVLAVSKTGASEQIVQAARIARDNGASVIAITTPHSALMKFAQYSLLVDVDEDTGLFTPMSSRLAQLAVLDVLQVALALHMGTPASQKLDKTKQVLQHHR